MLEYEISPADAVGLVRDQKARLIDVREHREVAVASVPGAVVIPMGEIPARAEQELDPEERLVVLCHHGSRSLSVTAWLRNQGFLNAQSVRGGIDAWSRELDPSIPRY